MPSQSRLARRDARENKHFEAIYDYEMALDPDRFERHQEPPPEQGGEPEIGDKTDA